MRTDFNWPGTPNHGEDSRWRVDIRRFIRTWNLSHHINGCLMLKLILIKLWRLHLRYPHWTLNPKRQGTSESRLVCYEQRRCASHKWPSTICNRMAYDSMDPDVGNSSSQHTENRRFLLKSAEWETAENFYTEIRTIQAFECIITWVGKGRFCIVHSKPHGDHTEFRKDVSTPVWPIILWIR